jgi:hypothetical protein
LIVGLTLLARAARADQVEVPPAATTDEVGDQGIAADAGIATGGRVTPGGLRLAGHYFYQLSDRDWFDGTAAFTFGGGAAKCFHDRDGSFVCDHGMTQGDGIEVVAAVRRLFAPQGKFRPFARAGIGLAVVHFSADAVTGVAIPLHLGAGIRAQVAEGIAVVAQGEVELGFGAFDHSLGFEPQLGTAVVAGAEFRLR